MNGYESFFLFSRNLKRICTISVRHDILIVKVRKYKKGKGKQPMIKIDDWVIEKGEKAQGKIETSDVVWQCRLP